MAISEPLDRDAQLAGLLDELLERQRRGEAIDFREVGRTHPDLVDELRGLWTTIAVAEGLAESLHDDSSDDRGTLPLIHPINRRSFGHYELLDELGRGGMGIVYRARETHVNRIVALKMLLRGDLASPADFARFRTEAEAAARLDHPNIVPVYEVGEFEGRPYFSMKLIEGKTLAQRLAAGPLPNREAAAILLPIARAIAEAHRRGVLHRDLKPSNIIIDPEGRAFVTDFGLAKRFSVTSAVNDPTLTQITQSGAVLGTPSYMAPEQAAGGRGEIGQAADVYSLGAILYAMLTGRPPFQAASAVDTILMVLEQEPLPPRFLNPKGDPDLEMIALKCLQKPADLRYHDADVLADDLEAYLNHEPISARSSHFSQILTRAFRETHHAAILENWGLLWMWHSLVVVLLCFVTNVMHWQGVATRWPYVVLWSFGVGVWAAIFWGLRKRSGPITFVERQIAHVWGASTACSTLLYVVEWILDLPVLTLSPVLALVAASVFVIKASVLSGKFYVQAGVLYLTAFVMAAMKARLHWDYDVLLYGVILGLCFFLPGLKYYRLRREGA